jgi:spermidine synthase
MNHALLFSVFIIASCGLAYELIAGALASYLLGDSVTQFSTVIGSYLFAMGIGSWLSRYIEEHLVARFIQVELLVGVLGGFSAAALFFIFAWSSAPFKLALYLACSASAFSSDWKFPWSCVSSSAIWCSRMSSRRS